MALRAGLEGDFLYREYHIRWMAVMGLVLYRSHLYPLVKESIRSNYGMKRIFGAPPGLDGPLSYKSYCQYMCVNGFWGDEPALMSLAMTWGVRISVVNSVSLTVTRILHSSSLAESDLVLVHNDRNHYCAAGVL